MAIGTLAVLYGAQVTVGDQLARTMGLTTFSLFNILFALETADEQRSIFGSLIVENATLIKTTALSVLATVMATELRLFQAILDTTNLNLSQWGICPGAARSIVVVAEAWKLILRFRPGKEPRSEPAPELQPAAQG